MRKATSATGTRDSSKRTAHTAGLNKDGDGRQSSKRAENGTESADQPFKKPRQLTPLPSYPRPVFRRPKQIPRPHRKNSISPDSSNKVGSSQGKLRRYIPDFELGSLSDTLQVTRSCLIMRASWPTTAALSLRPPVVSQRLELRPFSAPTREKSPRH